MQRLEIKLKTVYLQNANAHYFVLIKKYENRKIR